MAAHWGGERGCTLKEGSGAGGGKRSWGAAVGGGGIGGVVTGPAAASAASWCWHCSLCKPNTSGEGMGGSGDHDCFKMLTSIKICSSSGRTRCSGCDPHRQSDEQKLQLQHIDKPYCSILTNLTAVVHPAAAAGAAAAEAGSSGSMTTRS